MYSTEMKEDAHFFGMFCQAAKQSRAMLFAAAVLLGLSITAVSAGEKPKPFELGRYIGWLVSCGEIQGSQDEVGRALRRSIERYNSWGYSESDIDTVIKSLRHGIMGRLKWDNGEQICAKLAGNKQSVEWAKQLIERGRYEPGESAKTPTKAARPLVEGPQPSVAEAAPAGRFDGVWAGKVSVCSTTKKVEVDVKNGQFVYKGKIGPMVNFQGQIDEVTGEFKGYSTGSFTGSGASGGARVLRGRVRGNKLTAKGRLNNCSVEIGFTSEGSVASTQGRPIAQPQPAGAVAGMRTDQDTTAPMIEVAGAVVEIAGRVSDQSVIAEVTMDGRPIAVAPDGSFSVRRAVPVGTSTLRLAALDEWGNVARIGIAITRRHAITRPAKPRVQTPRDSAPPIITAPATIDTADAVIELAGALADDSQIKTPRVGQLTKYECNGAYGKERIRKVVRVEGGLIRSEGTIDGKKSFVEEYLSGIGTTLFKTRDRADGKGVRGQRFDEFDFKGYERLKPGSKYTGNVREWTNRGPWWWNYVISVGQPKMINHKLLGEIKVVPVTEIRTIKGQTYGSKLEHLVVPELGLELSAIYTDRKGTYKCDLVSFEPGG